MVHSTQVHNTHPKSPKAMTESNHSLAPSIYQMAIENLSQDLLTEILLRLPVKSLLRFKSVCKNWYALVQNPGFISLHHDCAASIAATQNTYCLLVKRLLRGDDGGGVVLSLVPNETLVEDIDISFMGLDIESLKLLGPCNGVICLTRLALSSPIVLCNPSMKEFRVLPQPYKNDHYCNLGFGFNPITNDYKVVRFDVVKHDVYSHSFDKKVQIYDLSTDSWRGIDAKSPMKSHFQCSQRIFASWNGDFYWYAHRYRGAAVAIMAFSMTDEVFKEILVPKVCMLDWHCDQILTVLKDSLALVICQGKPWSESRFDIWVMKEEDVEVSWMKKFTIGPFLEIDQALGFRQNGEFLVESCRQMMSYNLNTQERREYQVHDQVHARPPNLSNLQVLLYTESLVSVKRHNEHDEHLRS